MLELNSFFFWQLANFLILLIVLNHLLFKPLLRLFRERDQRINGSLDSAKQMGQERDELIHSIEQKIAKAREEAKGIFGDLRNKGTAQQRTVLDETAREADEMNKRARADLEQVTRKAKDSLKLEVDSFSRLIVDKMIKP